MNYNGIIVMAYYVLICAIIYFFIWYRYHKVVVRNERNNCKSLTKKKISLFEMIIYSSIFAMFNRFCTNISINFGSDRENYLYEFMGGRNPNSIGLEFVFNVVKYFKGDIYTVFAITTFVGVFLFLLAYRLSERAKPEVVLLIFASEWIFFTFTALKQTYACGIAAVFFVYLLEEKRMRGTIICFCLACIACLFHMVGFILFPILIIIRMKKMSTSKTIFFVVVILLCTIYIEPLAIWTDKLLSGMLSVFGGNLLSKIFSVLRMKISYYFVDNSDEPEHSIFSFIKYFPFYYITIIGFLYRKKMSRILEDYNKYMIVSFLASGIIIYSYFNYWFYRFIAVFYIPIFIYYVMVEKNMSYETNKWLSRFIVYGFTFLVTIRKIIIMFINYGGF